MERKQILIDNAHMYTLTQDASGQLYLEVVVGGFAMENWVIPLNEKEVDAYKRNGKSELNDLASMICKNWQSKYKQRRIID